MYTYEKNPYLKHEIIIRNTAGDIVCRLMYNDFAAVHDEPEREWEHMAAAICEAMNNR